MEVTLSPRARSIVIWVGVVAVLFLFFEAAHALRPFAWAVITAYIFYPVVNFIHRKTRLPKQLITAWLYIMIGLVLTILIINFSPTIADQVTGLKDEIPKAVDDVQVWIDSNQSETLRGVGLEPDFVDQRLNDFAQNLVAGLGDAAVPLVFSTFTIAIELVIYLVASFYFIVYGDKFINSLRSLLTRRYHSEFDRLLVEINATLGRYIRGQALLVVIMSVASFVALTILDVKYALIVSVLTGFLELIPLIGPWSAGAIAVSVALFQDSAPFGWTNFTLAVVVALTYFALRQFEDAFIIPNVIGRIVHLHPLLIIFVVVVGTSVGGVLGLILAVPLAAVAKIVSAYFYGKLMTRETRHVEVIRGQTDLDNLMLRLPQMINATVVLMIEPNALTWDDLPLVTRLRESALDASVDLSAVTPDGIAGTLTTAAGIATSSVPMASTALSAAMLS